MEESAQTGLPLVRPLWLHYPHDAAVLSLDQQFLLGPEVGPTVLFCSLYAMNNLVILCHGNIMITRLIMQYSCILLGNDTVLPQGTASLCPVG